MEALLWQAWLCAITNTAVSGNVTSVPRKGLNSISIAEPLRVLTSISINIFVTRKVYNNHQTIDYLAKRKKQLPGLPRNTIAWSIPPPWVPIYLSALALMVANLRFDNCCCNRNDFLVWNSTKFETFPLIVVFVFNSQPLRERTWKQISPNFGNIV